MTYRFPSVGGTDFCEEARSISNQRSLIEKIEEQKRFRKPLSKKKIQKRRQQRKNKKLHKRKR